MTRIYQSKRICEIANDLEGIAEKHIKKRNEIRKILGNFEKELGYIILDDALALMEVIIAKYSKIRTDSYGS